MPLINQPLSPRFLLAIALLIQGMSSTVLAKPQKKDCKIYTADRVFDGNVFHADETMAVIIDKDRIHQIMPASSVDVKCKTEYDLGDATILPGFIESHAHIQFQNVSQSTVLKHGITTARDVGGSLTPPISDPGKLRLVNTGPTIQAPGGYPLNLFGEHGHGGDTNDHHAAAIAVTAHTTVEAIEHVQHIANSGAVAIKVALEPGGETGAPWSSGHGHAAEIEGPAPGEWPLLAPEILEAIVHTAKDLGLPVIAHVGEQVGFDLAVEAGINEFAHIPCDEISQESITHAVEVGMRFQTTTDTLSGCPAIPINVHRILHAERHLSEHHGYPVEATIIYGSEIGHHDVPWGFNGQEAINMLLNFAGHNPVDFSHVLRVMKAATSIPGGLIGEQIGEPYLGTLKPGAPADIIAVPGNALEQFKIMEYPGLVVAGGEEVLNEFESASKK